MEGKITSVGETGRIVFGSDFEVMANSTIVSHSNMRFVKKGLLPWNVSIMDIDVINFLHPENVILVGSVVIKKLENHYSICSSIGVVALKEYAWVQ